MLAMLLATCIGCASAWGATLVATAGPTDPTIINAGGSDTTQLQSKLVPTNPGEENLSLAEESWGITSISESSDDVHWTVVWSGNSPEAGASPPSRYYCEVTPSSGGSAALDCQFGQDDFWQVSVQATATYDVTVNGQQEQKGPISSNTVVTSHTVADVTGISVATPNGATQSNMKQNYPNDGDQNWGIVKAAGVSVIMQVATAPATDPIWKLVAWQGGSTVPNADDERSYSAATSQEYNIKPTINSKGLEHTLNLWVIWATITIDAAGADPSNAPAFPPGEIGGQSLGLQENAKKNAVAFNNCQAAKVTPAGVHNALTGGFAMKQQRISHDFKNGAPNPQYFNTSWVSDGPETGFYTTKPDSSDKVYAIDGPDDGDFTTTSYDTYNNFRDWADWNGAKCASDANWYFQAGWNVKKTPEIYFASGGTGQITLPAADPAGPVP